MKKAIIVIVVLVILAIIGAGAYVVFGKKSLPGPLSTVTNRVTLNPNCKYNDPDLCKFINGWKEVQYFTATSSSTYQGQSSDLVMKSIGDDKSQFTMSQNGQENYNTIKIGDATYTKDYTDGKWVKTVAKTDATSTDEKQLESEIDFDEKADETADNTTYKKIGKEACGNLTCFKYQVIDPDITDSTEYIYFDDKEYQLRKMSSESAGATSETTFDYSKITISEPSPIKEGSQTNAYPAGLSGLDVESTGE